MAGVLQIVILITQSAIKVKIKFYCRNTGSGRVQCRQTTEKVLTYKDLLSLILMTKLEVSIFTFLYS